MNYEINDHDLITIKDTAAPPLCLVHYFGPDLPERNSKPPERPPGRIAERYGNLIILDFTPPPETAQAKWQRARQRERVSARLSIKLFLLLLLISILGCLLAARFWET